ncbi:MAG: hypothetical protein JWL77_5089 [Chthonomonadaceae bacterium]|nr:hypothetical protein [Chthonomonadaceae bacterium]
MNGVLSCKPYLLTTVWCWLLLVCVTTAFAQSRGRLRLPYLPPTAHVYVDAKPVVVRNSLLSLPAGWHQVQVEKQEKTGLQAYRRFVQVIADHTADMRIVWHPVLLAIKPGGYATYSPPGTPGPAGEPGPSARPDKPLPANADLAALRSPLQEARDILVSDFAAQVQDALNSLDQFAVPMYLYVPGPPFAEPPGPSGPIGPPGQPGIPAEAGLIQTSTGVPLQDRIAQRLGLPEMQQTLATLQAHLQHLSATPQVRTLSMPEPFYVLTPEWKTALDQEWKRRKAQVPQQSRGENFGIMGLPGAPGRRGPDGVAPAGAMFVRVSSDQEKQLLEILASDKATRARVEELRQQLTELTKRVYLAEGLHHEQFPPLSPAKLNP